MTKSFLNNFFISALIGLFSISLVIIVASYLVKEDNQLLLHDNVWDKTENFNYDGLPSDILSTFVSDGSIKNAVGSYVLAPKKGDALSNSFKCPPILTIPMAGNINFDTIHVYLENLETNKLIDLTAGLKQNVFFPDFVWIKYSFIPPASWSDKNVRIFVVDDSSYFVDEKELDNKSVMEMEKFYRTLDNGWVAVGNPIRGSFFGLLRSTSFTLPFFNIPVWTALWTVMLLSAVFLIDMYFAKNPKFYKILSNPKKFAIYSFILIYLLNFIFIKQYKVEWAPGGDEWRSIIDYVFIPFETGNIKPTIKNIFVTDSEHLVVPTRLFGLAMLELFGWSTYKNQIVQTIIPSALTALLIYWYLLDKKGKYKNPFLSIFVIILSGSFFLLPGTSMDGYLNHYFFLSFFSILTIRLSLEKNTLESYFISVSIIGLLANMSMGTGFFASFIAGCLLLLRFLFSKGKEKDLKNMAIFSFILSVLFYLQTGITSVSIVSGHSQYATSIHDMLVSLYKGLTLPNWPNSVIILLVTWVPSVIILCYTFAKKRSLSKDHLFGLGLLMWVGANAVANAIARGKNGNGPYLFKYDIFFVLYTAVIFIIDAFDFEKNKRVSVALLAIKVCLALILVFYTGQSYYKTVTVYADHLSIYNNFKAANCIYMKTKNRDLPSEYLLNNNRRLGGCQSCYWGYFINEHVYKVLPKDILKCD